MLQSNLGASKMLLLRDLLLSSESVQNKVRGILQSIGCSDGDRCNVCIACPGIHCHSEWRAKVLMYYGMIVEGKRGRIVPHILGKRAWSELSSEPYPGCVCQIGERQTRVMQ